MTTLPKDTPTDTLRSGFKKAETRDALRRLEDLAEQYRPDDKMERIAALPVRQREALFTGNPTLRVAYGLYAAQRAAHDAITKENPS